MQKQIKPSDFLLEKIYQTGITKQQPCCAYHYAMTLVNFMSFGLRIGSCHPEAVSEYCEKIQREIAVNNCSVLEIEERESHSNADQFVYELGDYNFVIPSQPDDHPHSP